MSSSLFTAAFGSCACLVILAAPAAAHDDSDASAGGNWTFGTNYTAVSIGGVGRLDIDVDDVTGFVFTVGRNPISVSAIGFWDEAGDGLDAAHDVGIYRQSDMVNLVSATVPNGVAAPLEDQFRYVSIEPTILEAGQSYQVVGYRAAGTLDRVGFNFPAFDVPPVITWDQGIFLNRTGGLTFATGNPNLANGIFGTNFQFVIASCDPCDMNCDGTVDALDIEFFIDILFNNGPRCELCTGDTNADGRVDAADIEGFINCLFP